MIPSGVSSKAHVRTRALGNPAATIATNTFIIQPSASNVGHNIDAARVGAWVCGRAAEIAIFNGGESEQSLLPRDVLTNLGRAFREL